jgi:hypothetical protein
MSYTTKVYKDSNGDRQVIASGGTLSVASGGIANFASGSIPMGVVLNLRTRATAAQVNAGLELLPALAGYKYRLVDVTMIAIGGNAATATSVDIITTQAASAVRPIVAAVAALTRSAVVKPNSANVAVLADGASFVANDANTAVSVGKQSGGSGLATATHVDVILDYVIEAA